MHFCTKKARSLLYKEKVLKLTGDLSQNQVTNVENNSLHCTDCFISISQAAKTMKYGSGVEGKSVADTDPSEFKLVKINGFISRYAPKILMPRFRVG